jgi:hypothetical protein
MGEERGFRHYSQPQIQLTPQAQKQIAVNELQREIDHKQSVIFGLQKQVLALQQAQSLIREP